MDPNRFDTLTRSFASRLSRRAALSGAIGLLAAAGARPEAGAQVSQARCGNTVCASNPGVCADGCVCCVYANGNSRCRPPGTCGPGETVCPAGEVADPVAGCVTTTTTSTTTSTTTTSTTTTTPAPVGCVGAPDGTVCGAGGVGRCDGGQCFRAAPFCAFVGGCTRSSGPSKAIPGVELCVSATIGDEQCTSTADCLAGKFCGVFAGGAPDGCSPGCIVA